MVQLDEFPTGERAQDFLRSRKIVWLATLHPGGKPHIVPVWFLCDQDAVYILSQPGAQKVKNLLANPKCSLAVDDSENGHQPVAMDGIASLEPAMLSEELLDRYFVKYREMLAAMNWTADRMVSEYSRVIRVMPTRFLKVT